MEGRFKWSKPLQIAAIVAAVERLTPYRPRGSLGYMDRKIIIATILALIAGLFVAGQQLLRSPDYVATGSCTASEIDKTYDAIEAQGLFGLTTHNRVMYDFWRHHAFDKVKISPSKRIDIGVKKTVYGVLSKRQTAAFTCNHPAALFVTSPKARTIPDIIRVLQSYRIEHEDIWATATCFSTLEVVRASPPTTDSINRFREICADRANKAKP